jgi:hypothetical protein
MQKLSRTITIQFTKATIVVLAITIKTLKEIDIDASSVNNSICARYASLHKIINMVIITPLLKLQKKLKISLLNDGKNSKRAESQNLQKCNSPNKRSNLWNLLGLPSRLIIN